MKLTAEDFRIDRYDSGSMCYIHSHASAELGMVSRGRLSCTHIEVRQCIFRSEIPFSNVFWDLDAVVVLSARSHDLPIPNVQISPL